MKGFEILTKLGEGAYSIVYKVRRKVDNKAYALKKVLFKGLNEKEKNNSINEVRILASIKSPFVVGYKEAFISEQDKSLCLIMEYADRSDLYQKITSLKKRRKLFEEADVWKIFIQITRGLKSLHDLKILHRDFKSANIFLFSDGTAKIGDLNVSKVLHKNLGYTQTGTPYYASPEVWNNEPYDAKSDIWSLACITYEMLTLNPPFRAETFDGLYKKVISGKYNKINRKYSDDMNQLLKLLFKVNPKERPSCGEILRHPLIQKRIDFFKAQIGLEGKDIDYMDDNELLKTIRLPKNLLGLSEKLPKPNYELPEINNNNTTNNNKTNSKNNTGNNFRSSNTFQKNNNKNLPNIRGNKTKTNNIRTINNTNSFKKNINYSSKKCIFNKSKIKKSAEHNNMTQKIYSLYGSPRKTMSKRIKNDSKREFTIDYNTSKRKYIKDRRVLDTYRLYVTNDSKRFLGRSKKNFLPKLRTNVKSLKK